MKQWIKGMMAGMVFLMLAVNVYGEEGAETYENYSEEITIIAEISEYSNILYLPETGEACGYRYTCRMEGSRWYGNWFSLLKVHKTVTKSYTVNGEPITETDTSLLQAFDQSTLNTETWEESYPEDYYYIKGAELIDDGIQRMMVYDPEPTITEVTVVYNGMEVTVPYTPPVAEVTKVVPYHYTVMLLNESGASYYLDEPFAARRELTGDAFAGRDRNDNRYDVMNYMKITGFDYKWNMETMQMEKTVRGTYLDGCYGMDYDTPFDENTVRPVAQAILTYSGGMLSGYDQYGTIELSGAVSFDELSDGYVLQTSDNGRTVTGRITEEGGSEHEISLYLAVKGPTLYASYTVSIPAAFTLEDLGNSFRGSFPIGVTIISNNEDFYVEVKPQETVLSGVLTGDVVRLNVTQNNRRFQIGPLIVPYTEVSAYVEEDVVIETEGKPERADTYSGTLSFTITSGTE